VPSPSCTTGGYTAKSSCRRAHGGDQRRADGGGRWWLLLGIQAVFQHTKGVISATSGYSGGSAKTAEYELVSTGETGTRSQ